MPPWTFRITPKYSRTIRAKCTIIWPEIRAIWHFLCPSCIFTKFLSLFQHFCWFDQFICRDLEESYWTGFDCSMKEDFFRFFLWTNQPTEQLSLPVRSLTYKIFVRPVKRSNNEVVQYMKDQLILFLLWWITVFSLDEISVEFSQGKLKSKRFFSSQSNWSSLWVVCYDFYILRAEWAKLTQMDCICWFW